MHSFGFWSGNKPDDNTNIETPLELHINVWNVLRKKEPVSFIDFGVGVVDFRKLTELRIFIPFVFDEDDVVDLYECMRLPYTARLVFNKEDCEIESVDQYYCIRDREERRLLIRIKDEHVLKLHRISEGTILKINFKEIESDKKYSSHENLYFRFRIISPEIEKALYCPVEEKNWFLESGFTKTQIVDVKINKERNVPPGICQEMRREGLSFARFKAIHFLVMCNSNNSVESFGGCNVDCRKLETEGWNDYLKEKYDVSSVLAYHWKEKTGETGKWISDYGVLIKISSAATNYKLIMVYIVVVIILGALGNALYSFLSFLRF